MSVKVEACQCGSCGVLERVRYFPEQLITAEDLNDQSEFILNKMRRHNRYLHGFGIVCGLTVEVAGKNNDLKPLEILIHPGYALSPCGDEVEVVEPWRWDLSGEMLGAQDCHPPKTIKDVEGQVFFPSICPSECLVRPVRVRTDTCGCDEMTCEFSRIRESFCTKLLNNMPESYRTRPIALRSRPCLPCPTDNCAVLGRLKVEKSRLELARDSSLYIRGFLDMVVQ